MIKRKICFVNSANTWGGGEKWHLESALRCKSVGYAVSLIVNPKSELQNQCKQFGLSFFTKRISNLSFLNPFTIITLYRNFKKTLPDVVVLNLPSDLKTAGVAAHLAGIKKIIYRRGSAIAIRNSIFNKLLFKYVVNEVVANSEETKRTILQNNPNLFNSHHIHVVYNGLDLEKYPYLGSDTKLHGPLVIGAAGRLVFQKGFDLLIQSLVKLKERNIPIILKIAGKGPLEGELKRYANELHVGDMIEFLGFKEDLQPFFNSIDVFVLSSRWEGFGFVIAEAMAYGKPVVAYNISSNPEIITEAETGYLVQPFDVESFANAILQLNNNRQLLSAMGAKGRQRVEQLFDAQKNWLVFEKMIAN